MTVIVKNFLILFAQGTGKEVVKTIKEVASSRRSKIIINFFGLSVNIPIDFFWIKHLN